MAESLFLTVNILDHFLEIRTIAITKLQLVGLATFLVATKFKETYASSVKEIVYLADNQYTVDVRATADGGAELAGDPKLDIFTE